MPNKILLVGTDRKYFHAERDSMNGLLKKGKDYVQATDFLPYGFEFKFGNGYDCIKFGCGENYMGYAGLSRQEILNNNLMSTIIGLENKVKEAGADFALVDNLKIVGSEVSGKAKLLIKK